MRIRAHLYRQFDADYRREVAAEGFAGWTTREVDLAPEHTAIVVMHAWDSGGPGDFPGWKRAVEYTPRANRILKEVFPRLLKAVRASPLRLFHVVGGERDYYSHLPGYREAAQLAGSVRTAPPIVADARYEELQRVRREEGSPGAHNLADCKAGFERIDFAAEARPIGTEGVAKDGDQLAALCHAHGINHLVYIGFAINWCLLMSPGGMVDMARRRCICSTIREAVTAVENRETAREEREKAQALWRVAVEFGFVFDLDDFISALGPVTHPMLPRYL